MKRLTLVQNYFFSSLPPTWNSLEWSGDSGSFGDVCNDRECAKGDIYRKAGLMS